MPAHPLLHASHARAQVLASLVDSHNNILVPGFYSNVRPNMLQPALQRLESSQEFSLDG